MRVSDQQMTLGELISTLKRKRPETPVYLDFVHFVPDATVHSYRGYYEDLAIGYKKGGDCSVSDLLAALEKANGATFHGWKGGEYDMDDDTPVWVANDSESGGTAIMDVVDDKWRIILKTEMID